MKKRKTQKPLDTSPRVRWFIVDRHGQVYESTSSTQRKGAWAMWRFAVLDDLERCKKEFGLRAVKMTVRFEASR